MFDKIHCSSVARLATITPARFCAEYKDAGIPLVLTELTAQWPATKKWGIDYLSEVAGENTVPVYSSQPAKGKQHQHAAAIKLRMTDYLQMLRDGESNLRMFFYNIFEDAPVLLKDFTYPKIGLNFFKRLPVLFVGGRGAKVQMHYDIDLANLLLCHFGGTKHVLLIPPDQTKYVYKVPYSFSSLHAIDLSKPDFERYPALRKINAQVATLQHGDSLFIPSGYWHHVVYEEIGFSMTLRAMPTKFSQRGQVFFNIVVTRTVEGLMRRFFGQRWNDRNERLAVEKTNRSLYSGVSQQDP